MSTKAPCIAVLGTGSDVGKSIVTTALCRIFTQKGIRVAPFKAQNMSNNSGVTPEGLEMGRAQIVQAEAAGIVPHVDMNPILLKPTSDVGAQVVVSGVARTNAGAKAYHQQKESLFTEACSALDRLRHQYELIIMEGAGSCAEVNLMKNDIVNLSMAAYADAPVILVADIHRGGVFAQVVGTLACLNEQQRRRIKGVIINRFRGDIDLFKDGVSWIEGQTGLPVFGVLPWYSDFKIEDEDSVVIEQPDANTTIRDGPCIAVVRIPHISNFTDFDPLMHLEGVQVVYLEKACELHRFSAVILPGSKNTRNDLDWLSTTGWREAIGRYVKNGGHLLGVCGGYQMLGRRVLDPDGVEAFPGETAGLDLLPVETELKAPKTTTRTRFSWEGSSGDGYEIHMGQTKRWGGHPMFQIHARNQTGCSDEDGCIGENGRVMGTYIHGLFDAPAVTRKWLDQIGLNQVLVNEAHGPAARDKAYNALADHARRYLDIEGIDYLIKPLG